MPGPGVRPSRTLSCRISSRAHSVSRLSQSVGPEQHKSPEPAMKLLIILCSVAAAALAHPGYGPDVHLAPAYHGPPAPLAKDGRVVDTPEVAHAKAAHFHAYHDELSKTAPHSPDHGPHHEEPVHHAAPVHFPHVEHHVDYHHPEEHHVYHGPPAPLGHDGRVVDTHDVAHAKAAHFHAYAEQLAKVAHAGPHHEPESHHGGGFGF